MSQKMFQALLPIKEGIEVEESAISRFVHSELAKKRFRQIWEPLVKCAGERELVEASVGGLNLSCRLPVAAVWVIFFPDGSSDEIYSRGVSYSLEKQAREKLTRRLRVVLGEMGPMELQYLVLSIAARQTGDLVVTDTIQVDGEHLTVGMGFKRMSFLPRRGLERMFHEANLRLVVRNMLDGSSFPYLYEEAYTATMKHYPGLCAKIMKEEALAHRNRQR